MAINYDRQIEALRSEFDKFDTVDEGLEILKQISILQKQRYERLGAVLPARDGNIWYFDVEKGKFFIARFPNV